MHLSSDVEVFSCMLYSLALTTLYPPLDPRCHYIMSRHFIDWVEEGNISKNKLKYTKLSFLMIYRNVPKFSDRQVCANSADPDQTAEEQSDQGLHCLQFQPHLLDALL